MFFSAPWDQDQSLTVKQGWRGLSSERSTGGNTARTDPALYPDLTRRSNTVKPDHLVTGRVVQLYVQGSKEAINDRARDDYTLAGRSERFIAFYDEQALTGNGDQVQVTLDVSVSTCCPRNFQVLHCRRRLLTG